MIQWFDPQPLAQLIPAQIADLFAFDAHLQPTDALAQLAARQVMSRLPQLDEGKMFGVLVVRAPPNFQIGFLSGYSGMRDGKWTLDGFVPPLFDEALRDAWWPAQSDALLHATHEIEQFKNSRAVIAARSAVLDAEQQRAEQLAQWRTVQAQRRAERAKQRGIFSPNNVENASQLQQLDQESRADTRHDRELKSQLAIMVAAAQQGWATITQQIDAMTAVRTARSHQAWQRFCAEYQPLTRDGQPFSLPDCYAPHDMPGGAGDCAAPKLVGYANRHQLEPLALAEFWWGPPPKTGGRMQGQFYLPCRGKCGPLLPRMLAQPEVNAQPLNMVEAFTSAPMLASAGAPGTSAPAVLFEDQDLVIVTKPHGMLTIPGRSQQHGQSLQSLLRIQLKCPDLVLAHRLDQDTSGLMIACKHRQALVAMHTKFAQREVVKEYVAILQSAIAAAVQLAQLSIKLPLRADIDDRPRQVVDVALGKPAQTDWRLLGIDPTRVLLSPRTGRTHQLRVHCAHQDGLHAPIVGDRLYGVGDNSQRLMLHASLLRFLHPRTGAMVQWRSHPEF